MSEPNAQPVSPAANSTEAFQSAIAAYKQQQEGLTGQLAQLEVNYHTQKTQMEHTLSMLQGAVVAIEQIIKNVEDEAAAKAVDTKTSEVVDAVAEPAAAPLDPADYPF